VYFLNKKQLVKDVDIGILRICLIVVFLAAVPVHSGQFQPWSEKIFQYVEKEYGNKAAKRLRYLHELIEKNQGLSVNEKLKLVNDTMNRLPWIADEKHWKKVDFWATPLETITTFGGDCEDIAIAKWVVLNHLGISSKHLRLATVKIKRSGELHMVLLYIENPEAPPNQQKSLVLDNYISEIMAGRNRTDVLALYVFDASCNFTLISDDGSKRTIKGVYPKRKLRQLEDLKKKITENRTKYIELNDGRPFLPSGS
jgi:predicted transglutaminase-like cysteine proteinase